MQQSLCEAAVEDSMEVAASAECSKEHGTCHSFTSYNGSLFASGLNASFSLL